MRGLIVATQEVGVSVSLGKKLVGSRESRESTTEEMNQMIVSRQPRVKVSECAWLEVRHE